MLQSYDTQAREELAKFVKRSIRVTSDEVLIVLLFARCG